MIIACPHCGKQLKAGEKFMQSVQALPQGGAVKVKCTQCATPFEVTAAMFLASGQGGESVKVRPPAPPDLSWLASEAVVADDVVDELPLVMLLVRDVGKHNVLAKAFESLGYRVESAKSAPDAIEKMQFVVYSGVVLHTDFEGGAGVDSSLVHRHICGMDMFRRRHMLYVLVGDEFNTMYDLEALSYSANMVVNDRELAHFSVLLRKMVLDYESLFGPFVDELQIAGK